MRITEGLKQNLSFYGLIIYVWVIYVTVARTIEIKWKLWKLTWSTWLSVESPWDRTSMRDHGHWAAIWAWLWRIVKKGLLSVGGHGPLWAAPFPRQSVHTIYKWRNQVVPKQTNKQHMHICFRLLLTVGGMGPAPIPALTSLLEWTVTWNCRQNKSFLP